MVRYLRLIFCFFLSSQAIAQATFNDGWHTHKTRCIIKQYTYRFDCKSDMNPHLTDSSYTFVSNDSLYTLQIFYPLKASALIKIATTLGKNKLPAKTEKYKESALVSVDEWKYDSKNRVSYHSESDRVGNREYTHRFDYGIDKTSGGQLVTETSSFNGRIEFYTMSYYDKKGMKYKEVRLNDNKKDIIHVDSYTYDKSGRVKQRSTYFPEFRVTKKFQEGNDGDDDDKCYKVVPDEKLDIRNILRLDFVNRLLTKYKDAVLDDDCKALEFRLINHFYKVDIQKSIADRKNTFVITTVQNYY